MGMQYHPTDNHELNVITLESYVVPAHDVRLASSAEMDKIFGPTEHNVSYPSRIAHRPAEKHYTNQIREPGYYLATSDDGYMSSQVGELRTTHLSPRIGYVVLKHAEVEQAKTDEATEDVSAALLFTALERYPERTYVRVGREVVLTALGNFTESGSSVGAVRQWLLETNPWLAEGKKSSPRVHYPGAGQALSTKNS